MWQVQNVMSKHAYYHAAGLNSEEIAALLGGFEGTQCGNRLFRESGMENERA